MKSLRYLSLGVALVFSFSILLTQVALADSTSDINYQIIVVDDPADTSKVKKNVWVNMYSVKVG